MLQDDVHSVDAEDADIAHEANLSGAEELDTACSFVEIVGDRDDVRVLDD